MLGKERDGMTNTTSGALRVSRRAAMIALALALAVVLAGFATRPAAAEPTAAKTVYTVTDLGTLGGTSVARDINDSGQVAGQSQNTSGQLRAFLWENGQMTDLGTLGGTTSAARGIDDSGRVVGFSRISSTNNQMRAFLAEKGQMTNLGTLTGFSSSEAWHINDSGVAVGRSYNSGSQGRAVLWENGQIKDLGVFLKTPYSEAWGINNRGQVVGESGSVDQQAQAFLYDNDTGEVTDLGALLDRSVFPYSEAMGINDDGQVVGWSYRTTINVPPSTPPGPEGKAFLYEKGTDGTATVLPLNPLGGDLYSRARDIDESGRAVGWSRGTTGNDAEQFSAALWEDEKATDLNGLISASSDWKLTDAYAINEPGQIVGAGFKDGNLSQLRAFLLTPDTTGPKIECGTADDLWHAEDVSIPCKASDDETGLAAPATDASFVLSTSVPDSTETADARTDSREVCDAAGNCATAGPIGGNRVDKKAPDITINTPPDGAEYKLGEAVAASYGCTDAGSGVVSCAGPVPNGNNIDTASVGQKDFAVEARDEAGNVAPKKSRAYAVIYDFSGFFSPVDNPPTLNIVNAGRGVPVKFGLSGYQGLDIFAEGYPASQGIECASTAPVDGVEETVAADASGLTYDLSSDQYDYVWKTQKAWDGTCRQLVIKLKDGTFHRANFKLR